MAWVDLSGAFGYGTKLTSTQMQNLRDNITALANGDSGHPEIVQTALKTSIGSVNRATELWGVLTLPGGEYGFYPQLKAATAGTAYRASIMDIGVDASLTETYLTVIALYTNETGYAVYAQQRYVTSSGEIHWIFILRDKATKHIISMWQAPDHPCFGNGGKPELISHPFRNYDSAKHEIIVINPSEEEVKTIQEATILKSETESNKDFLEVIFDLYDLDETQETKWPTKEVTVGLPPNWDDAYYSNGKVNLIKKVIPKPDYVFCKSLKLKAGK